MANSDQIAASIKEYILQDFLPGENPDMLTEDTALVESGVLDSLAILKLVAFIEEQFDVALEAHEVDTQYMNTISDMVKLVLSKK